MNLVDYSNVVSESTQVIDECFKKYKVSEIFVAFNGGKDCTVLLDIIVKLFKNRSKDLKNLSFVYIQQDEPFTELEEFIYSMEKLYELNLSVISGNIKAVLEKIIKVNPSMKACLMGTRRTDPHSENLNYFHMTDKNWPQVMRVNPLLDWSYHEIWSYLIDQNVQCCSLYNVGYTSIGNSSNTIPNPSLKSIDPATGTTYYKPAYFLNDGALERNGRMKSKGVN